MSYDDFIWEVIELNKLGDHIMIKRFEKKIQAIQFAQMMSQASSDGEEYYVNDIRTEWHHDES